MWLWDAHSPKAETLPLNEVTFIGRCVRLEVDLP